ncbi:ABC-type sugar transport system ATPase subunit [Paraburkholderia sp. JPY465]
MTTPVLQMTGVDKTFGATRALSGVKLTVHPGEIHALMGENGAGKSTLMKILSGVYQPDAGEIRIEGKPVRLANPAASRALGISLIYQELAVAPHMSVAENVFMGSEPRSRFGLSDRAAMLRQTQDVLQQLGRQISSLRPGGLAFDRGAAAGRDRACADPSWPRIDHGRADRRAFGPGGRTSVFRRAQASR